MGTFVLARIIVSSTYGKVLVAIRDAESRTRFLGYRVEHHKLLVFTLSAMIAGWRRRALCAAGRHHQPVGVLADQLHRGGGLGGAWRAWHAGRRSTWRGGGELAQDDVHLGWLAAYWLFALGGLFVLVTLAMPRGLIGLWDDVRGKLTRKPAPSAQVSEQSP